MNAARAIHLAMEEQRSRDAARMAFKYRCPECRSTLSSVMQQADPPACITTLSDGVVVHRREMVPDALADK